MIATWITSPSEMPRMLPMTIACTSTAVGFSETISRPNAKNEVKTMPITASSRSLVRCRTITIAAAARPPAKKAPIE
jgi:hypothetical protein